MCGRFVLRTPPDRLAEYFDAAVATGAEERFAPRFNVAPTTQVLALALDREARRTIDWYRWGLVPPWAADPSVGNRMFNARDDRLGSSRAYRRAFHRRRLAVLADGYWEWQRGPGGARQPFYFHRADGEPLAMAGLYEHWRHPGAAEGEGWLASCTVVTTDAPPGLRDIHDRMPALLAADALALWLDPEHPADEELVAALQAGPSLSLEAYPVDRRVGNVRNDDEHLLDPLPSGTGAWHLAGPQPAGA